MENERKTYPNRKTKNNPKKKQKEIPKKIRTPFIFTCTCTYNMDMYGGFTAGPGDLCRLGQPAIQGRHQHAGADQGGSAGRGEKSMVSWMFNDG